MTYVIDIEVSPYMQLGCETKQYSKIDCECAPNCSCARYDENSDTHYYCHVCGSKINDPCPHTKYGHSISAYILKKKDGIQSIITIDKSVSWGC